MDYSAELQLGLGLFEDTRGLAPAVASVHADLEAALATRSGLRPALLAARVGLRHGNWLVDGAIRAFHAQCVAVDKRRGGPTASELFPNGLDAEVSPRGRAQIKPAQELMRRVSESKSPAVGGLRESHLPALRAEVDRLVAAGAAYKSAEDAYLAAFATEIAARHAHRVQMLASVNLLRGVLRDDSARLDVIVPDAADDTASPEPSEPEVPAT